MDQQTLAAENRLPSGVHLVGQVLGTSEKRPFVSKKGHHFLKVITTVFAGDRLVRASQLFPPHASPRIYEHGEDFVGEIIPEQDPNGQLVVTIATP